MRIKWKNFELPARVILDEKTSTQNYAKFVAEPFQQGFGTTIGNSLRRILLSSIEGAAITAVKFKGVPHQFTTINGIVEDVTDILLNIKKLVLKITTPGQKVLKIDIKEKGEIKGAHIIPEAGVEIVNPDLHIATLVEDKEFYAEMIAQKGRGYLSTDDTNPSEYEIGGIPIDAVFSPVRRVKYKVENTRVGKLTNYDRLIIEIWTNGAVTPEMALVEASKILRKHLNPFVQYFHLSKTLQYDEKKEKADKEREEHIKKLRQKLAKNISELDLSVRSYNCLLSENINTVADLVSKTEAELLKMRNFGKTSLKEIQEKLGESDLYLGMNLDEILGDKKGE